MPIVMLAMIILGFLVACITAWPEDEDEDDYEDENFVGKYYTLSRLTKIKIILVLAFIVNFYTALKYFNLV